ncbi:MAG TPA: nuclear transport factor 2 family protein [Mycobacterium sp.]|nr:nuclear transport factor 2 family protein [Mycobacterium sp.]
MAFTGPAQDRQTIRELFEIYSDAVIRRDLDTYLACWADNCRRSGAGGECEGKDELRAHWHGIFGALEQMVFFTQMASLTVDGDSAAARSYCLEILKLKDGNTRQLVGEYDDELVRVDGDWLFSHRRYQVAMTF